MFLNAALLGIASAIDPSSFATIAYFLTRDDPPRLLRAYLIGGMGLSVAIGLAAVFALQGVGAGRQQSFHPIFDISIGAFALIVAVIAGTGTWNRIVAKFRARRAAKRATALNARATDATTDAPSSATSDALSSAAADAPSSTSIPGFDKLPAPVRTALEEGSPWIAWVLGIGFGMPGAYYFALVTMVIRSHLEAGEQIAAILIFNALMFVAVIVPLVAYRRNPAATQLKVNAMRNWVFSHGRMLIATIAGLVGIYLIVRGISKL